MSSTPFDRSRHCPSFGPTRLAVGLELEVFYTKCLQEERFVIRPVFRLRETLVPPCHSSLRSDFGRHSNFQTEGMLLPCAGLINHRVISSAANLQNGALFPI